MSITPISFVIVAAFALLCAIAGLIRIARRRPVAVTPRLRLIHSINDDRCTACDACVTVCPTDVLELVANKSRVMRFDDCIQCNQCELVCPTAALVMHRPDVEPPRLRMPLLDTYYQAIPGLYLIGEAAGKPLVKNASNLGRAVVEHMIQGGLRPDRTLDVDVLIVGSGPGGLSTALSCIEHGLSHLVLEKDELVASTIARYPKGKLVMAEPHATRCLGRLPVWDADKEELLAAWKDLIAEKGVRVSLRETVDEVVAEAPGQFAVRSTRDGVSRLWRAARVVAAIGTRGKPRRLDVPGEHLQKVTPIMKDPEAHRRQHVLVVGGGDSAVEAALALAEIAATVTLSYRGKALARCKSANRQALEQAIATGRVRALFGSTVVAIGERAVMLRVGGATREIRNDHVIAAIGAAAPVQWLQTIGVRFVDQPHMFAGGATDSLIDSILSLRWKQSPAPPRTGETELSHGTENSRRYSSN